MLWLCPLVVSAQVVDSSIAVPQGKVRVTYLNNLNHSPDLLLETDTLLTGLQREFNPYYYNNLGNLGSPVVPLVWSAPRVAGFRFGFNQWDFLRLTSENIGYYNTQNPFSELFYVQGSAREKLQVINALHTQNIMPNWNASFRLRREGSIGYYEQQNARHGNLGLNTWYRSPNRRYLVAASAIFNSFSFEENGGLRDAGLFADERVSGSQRQGQPFRLRDARQAFDDKDFNIQQFLYFGPTETRRVKSDSDSVAVIVLKPRFYLMQQSNYYSMDYAYRDTLPTLTFYRLTSDTLITKDAYGYSNFSNKVGFGYTFTDSAMVRNYSLQAYLKYDHINTHLKRSEYDSRYNNTSLGFNGQKLGKFNVAFSGELVLKGFNGGDFFVDGSTTAKLLPSLKLSNITLYGRLQNYSPAYTERYFISNHFSWINTGFTQTQTISAGGYIWDNPTALRLGANYTAATNFVYWGKDTQPQQASTALHYFQLNAARNFVLGNFHFYHNLTYQKQLQGDFIRIPDFVVRTSYFYQNRVFRHKPLLLQVGFDLGYNSAYTGYSYMPGLSKFYLQDSAIIGNYPVFDAWLAGQVKRFMIFFKVEHVTEGLFGASYFNAVNYPVSPRTIRFGLKWRFFN